MAATHTTRCQPHTGTFGVGTIATAATERGPDSAACPTSEDWNHCNGDFAAKFASCMSVSRFADTAGPRALGLDCSVVFFCVEN